VPIVSLVDCLPRLFIINCSKPQSTLLAKIKIVPVQIKDGLFIVQQVVEKRITRGEKMHIIFIDLEKAYDSVPRN